MDEKHELDRLRQRVKLLEEIIDRYTQNLASNSGNGAFISKQMRKEAGLPPFPGAGFR